VETNLRNRLFSNNLVWNYTKQVYRVRKGAKYSGPLFGPWRPWGLVWGAWCWDLRCKAGAGDHVKGAHRQKVQARSCARQRAFSLSLSRMSTCVHARICVCVYLFLFYLCACSTKIRPLAVENLLPGYGGSAPRPRPAIHWYPFLSLSLSLSLSLARLLSVHVYVCISHTHTHTLSSLSLYV